MRALKKVFKLFNSLVVISLVIMVAMVLTTISSSASTQRDAQLRLQSLSQSHLLIPSVPTQYTTRTSLH